MSSEPDEVPHRMYVKFYSKYEHWPDDSYLCVQDKSSQNKQFIFVVYCQRLHTLLLFGMALC